MNKLTLLVLFFFSASAYSHDFLTEILVYNDEYQVNPYHVAASYDLAEQDIHKIIKLRQIKADMAELVEKSNVRELTRQHGHSTHTHHHHEAETEVELKTHGVFDHITESRLVAIDLCDAIAMVNYMTYPNGLIPQFVGPSTFTDGSTASEDHHDLYDYADGLQFNCVEVIDKKLVD